MYDNNSKTSVSMSEKKELLYFLEQNFGEASKAILQQFESYSEWLLRENLKVNLISRKTDPDEIWIRHFLDSILSVGCIDFRNKNILDVGTGGGFPGVPLAVLYPDARFTLLDATKKKIQSVKAGVAKLSLLNCSFLDVRLEEVPKQFYGTFDIVVCRSVRIIPGYKKHLFRLLKDHGRIVLYKSKNLDDVAQFRKISITDVGTPLIGERKIVVIEKSEN